MNTYELIKSRIFLPDYVKRYIEIKKRGKNFSSCCPFHAEKTPSFFVYENSFFCFGCKKKGDIFDFVSFMEGLSKEDCLKKLCLETGVKLPSFLKEDRNTEKNLDRYQEFLHSNQKFWKKICTCLTDLHSDKEDTDLRSIFQEKTLLVLEYLEEQKSFTKNFSQCIFSLVKSCSYFRFIVFSLFGKSHEEVVTLFDVYLNFLKSVQKTNREVFDCLLILEKIAHFFELSLKTSLKAKKYLEARGIGDTILGKYRLGYAPSEGRHGFFLKKLKEDFSSDQLLSTGILIFKREALHFLFWNRIVFPIYDRFGNVISFGARKISTNVFGGKYINGANNPVFQKKKTILNFHNVITPLKRNPELELFIVEGYIDILSCTKKGIINVISFAGTAVSSYQIETILLFSKNISICFDSDKAGLFATEKLVRMFLENMNAYVSLKVILLPEGEDPDSFLKKLKETSLPFFSFVNRSVLAEDFLFSFISQRYFPMLKDEYSLVEQRKSLNNFPKRLRLLKKDLDDISFSITDKNLREVVKETFMRKFYDLKRRFLSQDYCFEERKTMCSCLPDLTFLQRLIGLLAVRPELLEEGEGVLGKIPSSEKKINLQLKFLKNTYKVFKVNKNKGIFTDYINEKFPKKNQLREIFQKSIKITKDILEKGNLSPKQLWQNYKKNLEKFIRRSTKRRLFLHAVALDKN